MAKQKHVKRANSVEPSASAKAAAHEPVGSAVRLAQVYGWTALACFMAGGLALEFLHLIKAPWYFEVRIRRELWTLAHAHGTLLSIVCIVWAAAGAKLLATDKKRGLAAKTLCAGALLMPAGFFLGGIGNTEIDPSLMIILTPIGALLLLHATAATALGAWRAR